MKTSRDVVIYKPSIGYSITVPKGTALIFVGGVGGGYAVERPTMFGASQHDATHYYFFVPDDAVSK